MADFLYYATFVVTSCIALGAGLFARRTIGRGAAPASAKMRFTVAGVAGGILSGIVFFAGTLWLLDLTGHKVNVGHGESLVAAAVFNLLLGLFFGTAGRILIGWRVIRW